MDAGPTDAGPMDAGPMDAGPTDAAFIDTELVHTEVMPVVLVGAGLNRCLPYRSKLELRRLGCLE